MATPTSLPKPEKAESDSSLTSAQLAERTLYRRAVEAVLWGLPAVNSDLLYKGMAQCNGTYNQIVYWSRPFDWKNQTLTPNPGTVYFMPFYNTREVGPMVLEIPPAEGGPITGSVDDGWQTAIEDVGPVGVDKGKGGEYLILPPGHKDPVPAGYITMYSETYAGFAILRSNLENASDEDVTKAVAYGKTTKFYPLSQAANPPQTKFVDAVDVVYDSTIPYDLRFFESLDRFVQNEPWLTRDKVMIDVFMSIGTRRANHLSPTRTRRKFSTKPDAKHMHGTTPNMRRSFHLHASKGRTGRCQHHTKSWKASPRISPTRIVIP